MEQSHTPVSLEYASPAPRRGGGRPWLSPGPPADPHRLGQAGVIFIATAVVTTLISAFTADHPHILRRNLGWTWPEIWIPWDEATGRAGLTRPRVAWLLEGGSVASLASPWVAFWVGCRSLRDRSAPVALDLFLAGAALALISMSVTRQLRLPVFEKNVVYCLAPLVIGAIGGCIECAVRKLAGRWWVASLMAVGCAFAYYALLVRKAGVFTG